MAGCDAVERRSPLSVARTGHSSAVWRAAPPVTVAALTLAVFAPALWNGFVWDDEFNLLDNPRYRGLGWTQLAWMFTAYRLTDPGLGGQWIPLTWMTFALDYLAWGVNPVGYHLTNVLLHAANGVVFYFVARRLLASATAAGDGALRLGAGTAALFFALHPLRAESVAWITERRDVLSMLFFLLTVIFYLKAAANGPVRRRWLAGSVASYALSLSAKAMGMTLPLVLLVLDAYPLRRLAGHRRARLVEKVPYLILSIAIAGVTLVSMRTASGMTSLADFGWPSRVALAFHSLAFYVWKTILPLDSVPFYELPVRVDPLAPRFLGAAIAVLAAGAIVLALRRRWPAGLAAGASYAIVLAPVSGLAQTGPHLVATRYSYFSCLGWALLVGAGVVAMAAAATTGKLRRPYARLALAAAGAWIIGLASLTAIDVQKWRDNETFWRSALEVDPACAMCLGNLGVTLGREGIWAPATPLLERALALRPEYVGFHRNLGLALLQTGRTPEAIAHFRLALAHYPSDAALRNYLGLALAEQRRTLDGVGRR